MIGKILALSLMGVFLVSCSSDKKNLETVSSSSVVAGSAEDFAQNIAHIVYFGFDKYNLTDEAKEVLTQAIAWLKMYEGKNITIEGHADKRGTSDYNLALGSRRAEALKAYLVAQGISGARISTISYGKESLVAVGETEQDHALNRRAQIAVVE